MLRTCARELRTVVVMAALVAAGPVAAIHAQPGGGGPGGFAEETPVWVDVDRFADLIEAELTGNCTGWQFAIYRNAINVANRAGGMARTSDDSPARSMSTSDRLETASCSKTVNAMATLAVLDHYGISIDASIIDYVPPSWNPHASIADISFADLLSHNSGLAKTVALGDILDGTPGQNSELVRATLEGGMINPPTKNYENINYAVVRVVVAYIVDSALLIPLEADDAAHEIAVVDVFADAVRQHVFVPAGLGVDVYPIYWHPSGDNYDHVRYYNWAAQGNPGLEVHLDPTGLGPGGWDLTSWQLAQIIAAWEAGYVLDPGMVDLMKTLEMGIWDGDWVGAASLGPAYTHNGGFGDSTGGGGGRLISFPGNVQVAFLVNSNNNEFAHSFTFVADAFFESTQRPDLVITSLETNGTPSYDGGDLRIPIRMTVQNQGSGDTASSFFNGVRYGEVFRWSGIMGALDSGESSETTGIVRIPDPGRLLAGRRVRLKGKADARILAGDTGLPSWARLEESNEGNNEASLAVNVPGGYDLTTKQPSGGRSSGQTFKTK